MLAFLVLAGHVGQVPSPRCPCSRACLRTAGARARRTRLPPSPARGQRCACACADAPRPRPCVVFATGHVMGAARFALAGGPVLAQALERAAGAHGVAAAGAWREHRHGGGRGVCRARRLPKRVGSAAGRAGRAHYDAAPRHPPRRSCAEVWAPISCALMRTDLMRTGLMRTRARSQVVHMPCACPWQVVQWAVHPRVAVPHNDTYVASCNPGKSTPARPPTTRDTRRE